MRFAFLGTVIALLIAFVVGPRPRLLSYKPSDLRLPSDLDAWLEEKEAAFPLRAGVQKEIQWARKTREKTSVAFSYLHGFSASRGEISPVLENVSKKLRANVFFSRLTGHGMDGSALAKVEARSYIDDGYEALAVAKRIGEKAILVGTSTGGAIATWMAGNHAEIDGLVLISPNFGLKDKNSWILHHPWGVTLAKLLVGPERSWDPENPLVAKFWTNRYPLESLIPMLAVTDDLKAKDLRNITVPVLVLYTPHDERVDTSLTEKYFSEIGSSEKEIIRMENAKHHVLAGDAVSPENNEFVISQIIRFTTKLTPQVSQRD